MDFQTQISNIFYNITGRDPIAAYNNKSPRGNRTVKLRDVSASPEELKKLEEAYRFAYPDRFIRVRNMTAISGGCALYHGYEEPKVVVSFTY